MTQIMPKSRFRFCIAVCQVHRREQAALENPAPALQAGAPSSDLGIGVVGITTGTREARSNSRA